MSSPEIPGFVLGELLGSGGMGAVWAATHGASGLPVAIKVLRAGRATDELVREAQAIAQLDHPRILQLYDVGEVGGQPYLVMARAQGALSSEKIPWHRLRALLLALLDALAHAHARGIIHRDIKPGNLLLDEDGAVLLADFGIAVVEGDGAQQSSGSLGYMAPEQLTGRWRQIGPWTDLFALGCTAAELILGRRLFTSADPALRLFHPSAFPELEPAVGRWLERLLAPAPAQRLRSAAAAAHALLAIPGDAQAALPTFGAPASASTETVTAWDATATIWDLDPEPLPAAGPIPAPEDLASAALPVPARWERAPTRRRPPRGMGLGLYHLRQPPLAGREAERERLWAALRAVHGGRSVAVDITGPSGVGRSHLARWLCERAAEVGAAEVLRVRCGAERRLLDGLWAALRCSALEGAALSAQLHHALPGLPPAHAQALAAAEGGSPDAVAEALWASLAAVSRERPVLLWIDDAHHSLAAERLARRLRRAVSGPRVLLLRTPGAEAAASRDATEHIALEPLRGEPLRQLLTGSLRLAPALAERLLVANDDDPALLTLVVEDWIRRDMLQDTPDGFVLRDEGAFALPDSLRAAWEEQLAALAAPDSPRWLMLERAAALGRLVSGTLWQAACADLGDTSALTEALLAAGVAEASAQGWRFRRGLLAETLVTIAKERGRWPEHCRRIVAAMDAIGLEPQGEGFLDQQLSAAPLLEDCGQHERAAQALVWSIHHLRIINDWRRIPEFLDRIVALADAAGLPADHPVRLQGRMFRAIIHSRRGDITEAARLLDSTIALKKAPWHIELESSFYTFCLTRARERQDIEAGLRYAAALHGLGVLQMERSRGKLGFGSVSFALGIRLKLLAVQPDRFSEEIAETIDVIDALPVDGEAPVFAAGLLQLSEAMLLAGELGRSQALAEEAMRKAEGRYPIHTARAHERLMQIADARHDPARTRRHAEATLRIYDAHDHYMAPAARAQLGLISLTAGDFAAAAPLLRRAEAELAERGNRRHWLMLQPVLANLEASTGDTDAAWARLEALDEPGMNYFRYADGLRLCAEQLLDRGHPALARRLWTLELAQREALSQPDRAAAVRALLREVSP